MGYLPFFFLTGDIPLTLLTLHINFQGTNRPPKHYEQKLNNIPRIFIALSDRHIFRVGKFASSAENWVNFWRAKMVRLFGILLEREICLFINRLFLKSYIRGYVFIGDMFFFFKFWFFNIGLQSHAISWWYSYHIYTPNNFTPKRPIVYAAEETQFFTHKLPFSQSVIYAF